MYLKIMGPENAPDSDPRKSFQIIEVTDASFCRYPDGSPYVVACIDINGDDVRKIEVEGNCYLMNESGKTVASFGSAKLSEELCRPGPPPDNEH